MFAIYDPDTLRLKYTMQIAQPNYEATLRAAGESYKIVPDGTLSDHIGFVQNGQDVEVQIIEDRPVLAFDTLSIVADEMSAARIDPCPVGTEIYIAGELMGVTEGEPLEIRVSEGGVYHISLNPPWPYAALSVEITATDAP